MSSTQVSSLLRFIRHLAVGWKDNELPDHQLLERFATLGEEAAFAALLRRHGPMVLRVCQRVLHNLHDAEDVFQAVFLVLARKADSIHRREAVSSWLYGVAHRLAMKAQASAARRKNHEKRAATMPSTEPLLDMSLRELQGILHEELQRLPEVYRAPLVLCGLEEKSLEEAARLLGWSKGCVKGRLQRGRDQLRLRLRRRGIDLSVGLLASALATNAMPARVSATLTATTLRAAMQFAADGKLTAGVVSANVVSLVRGAMPTMFFGKLKIVTVVVLTIGVSVAGLSAFSHRGVVAQQADPASKQSAKDAASRLSAAGKKTAKDMITVRGRVLDPEGKPLAGAKLYLGHYGSKDEVAVTELAKSDVEGRFALRFPKSQLSKAHLEPRPRDEADPPFTPVGQILAVGEGYGCDWARLGTAAGSIELTLRLVKDVPLSGRILDQDGKPVAGAKLRLSIVQAYPGEKLEAALAEFREWNHFPGGAKRWGDPLPGQARTVTTGPDGRFRMAGLGGERYVSLHIEGPGIASTDFQVITRPGDMVVGPDKVKVKGNRYLPPRPLPPQPPGGADKSEMIDVTPNKVYGATFRYLAAASRPIRGVVTDKVTGKPLAGVMIGVEPSRGGDFLTTRTDGEGRYELLGCPKSPAYNIQARPSDTGRYFAVLRIDIPDAPGIGPMTVDIKLTQCIPIRGKVLDERTGKPISGASVRYFCLDPNAASAIAFRDYSSAWSDAITGLDGSFAVVALPGPGIVVASAPDSTAGGRSRPYLPAKLTLKEWDAFVAQYKVPPPAFPQFYMKKWDDAEKCEVLEYVSEIDGHGYGPLPIGHFNSSALLHPDEKKDKELKLDLKIRPNDGEQKYKDKDLNSKGTGGSPPPPRMIKPKKKDQER